MLVVISCFRIVQVAPISRCTGNSSQVSDGAVAVLMARRSEAIRRGLRVFGVVRGYAVVGCSPRHHGDWTSGSHPRTSEEDR